MRSGHATGGGAFGEALLLLARERLTAKQRKIVIYLEGREERAPATRTVRELSAILGCSRSTVWNSLASLRRAGLLRYSSREGRGAPVALTPVGAYVAAGCAQQDDRGKMERAERVIAWSTRG